MAYPKIREVLMDISTLGGTGAGFWVIFSPRWKVCGLGFVVFLFLDIFEIISQAIDPLTSKN